MRARIRAGATNTPRTLTYRWTTKELDALAVESKHTIEIDLFVPREQIDERYLDSPYFITPDGQVGQDAFAVIREAMRGKDMVALGGVVLAKRERVIMLQPWDKGLMATTLRYPYEIRAAEEYFEDIPDVKVEPDMLKLAHQQTIDAGRRRPSPLPQERRTSCWRRSSTPQVDLACSSLSTGSRSAQRAMP